MKKTLLFVLALIATGCADAEQSETASDGSEQVTPSASCADIVIGNLWAPLEDMRFCAEQGDANAQTNLGMIYNGGVILPLDHMEARRWYRLAAEQGLAIAQTNLGIGYANGLGVPEDDAEAVRWYRLAAEQGYGIAQIQLGLMYEDGEGVPEDSVLAYMWYNLAAAQAAFGGAEGKDRLEERMTREQVAEAQRLSREWLEAHPSGGN